MKTNYFLIQVTDVRNFLMALICIINATRASNLINILVEDVKKATLDQDLSGFVFNSTKYKTSIIYGSKAIWLPYDIYHCLLAYITHFRPYITPSSSDYLFTSMRGNGEKMDHSLISNGLTSSFKKAGVILTTSTRISPSRIRCACVTELVGIGGEDCTQVAQSFMKHRPSTSKKFYIMHWENRQAIRYSMKCYTSFVKHKESIEGFVKEREKIIEQPLPTKEAVQQWLKINKKRIMDISGETMDEDEGLINCIDEVFAEIDGIKYFY